MIQPCSIQSAIKFSSMMISILLLSIISSCDVNLWIYRILNTDMVLCIMRHCVYNAIILHKYTKVSNILVETNLIHQSKMQNKALKIGYLSTIIMLRTIGTVSLVHLYIISRNTEPIRRS